MRQTVEKTRYCQFMLITPCLLIRYSEMSATNAMLATYIQPKTLAMRLVLNLGDAPSTG
jgi:hypothetical protein